METSEKLLLTPSKNNGDGEVATTSSSKVMDSPKTPVRTFDSSFEDEDTDEMESPKFPHLIPVYHRTPNEYDLEGVRIGWDDGFGSVCYQDDDYIVERNGKKFKRNRRNRLFSERRHRSFFGSHKNSSSQNSNSPSPSSNIAVIQAELNDYLGCILNCLSAKKRKRQLLKSKNDENSTNNSTENNISRLLDDSADDEMMLLCSQAIEKTIAADAEYTNETKSSNSLSIPGISPLKDTNDNVCHHAAKKFKSVHCSKYLDVKKNDNTKTQSHTITSSSINKSENKTNNTSYAINTVTNSNKEDLSLLLNDSLANDEDELFSAIDLSAIEQDILLGENNTLSVSAMQKNDTACNKQPQNTKIDKQMENKSNHCTTNNSNSLLWRKCTSSSSIVNPHSLLQKPNQKSFSGVNETTTNSKYNGNTENKPAITRYCTPAEIEAKRDRARRTLMLKFKSKNKSAM